MQLVSLLFPGCLQAQEALHLGRYFSEVVATLVVDIGSCMFTAGCCDDAFRAVFPSISWLAPVLGIMVGTWPRSSSTSAELFPFDKRRAQGLGHLMADFFWGGRLPLVRRRPGGAFHDLQL